MLELLKTTKKVLGAHKIPFDALDAVQETMRKSKAEIDSLLDLSEANLYRARITMDKAEADVRREYPYTFGVIAHILKEAVKEGAPIDLSTLSLTNNSIVSKNQEMKLSKVLAKHMAGKEDALAHCMKELKITKPEQFLPKLGDIVKSGRVLFVSTNILDFLTASDNSSFRSCHSFDGQHFNGNIAYCRDKMTVMTFVAESKFKEKDHQIYKLGRSWLFLAQPHIVQPKSYGAYTDAERKMVREFIINKIAAKSGVDPKEYLLKGSVSYSGKPGSYGYEKPRDVSSGGMAGYFDAAGLDVAHAGKEFKLPRLEFAAAACLVCGETTDHQRKGVCSEHDGRVKFTCAECGERHLAENCIAVGDDHYCNRCYQAKFSSCNHCHGHFLKDQIEVIDGNRVCPACLKKHYVTCGDCGGRHRKEKLVTLKGVAKPVCTKCVDNYLLCSICGDYHPADKVVYHKYVGRVCEKCTPQVAFRCSDCGEYHLLENRKDADGLALCAACEAKRSGKAVEIKTKPKYAGLPEGWEDFVEEIG